MPREINLKDFKPAGQGQCEAHCDRQLVVTKDGPVVACLFCKRIVIDRREKK
jgi:hypothetical protein